MKASRGSSEVGEEENSVTIGRYSSSRQGSQSGWGLKAKKIDVGFGHVNFEVLAGYLHQSIQFLNTFPKDSFAETVLRLMNVKRLDVIHYN